MKGETRRTPFSFCTSHLPEQVQAADARADADQQPVGVDWVVLAQAEPGVGPGLEARGERELGACGVGGERRRGPGVDGVAGGLRGERDGKASAAHG